jgi:hypothetical protein
METQLLILNVIILTALFMFSAFLVLKTIIYLNEIKLAQTETTKKALELNHENGELELEKSKTDLENTRLQIQYAEFLKANGGTTGSNGGYASAINETFKDIDKKK